ncbi:hypothetical protein F511_14649 [Dorcoceras hygrometricum]|uniref:Uncharacterized protein n=1 Tax=Dorcoceras hygrometricum TaxID=472368 RepID=A0A2Z7B0L9_9LAMI|nr:hypothetical protein F511_14649 [Dorcoceras hygrometricum]
MVGTNSDGGGAKEGGGEGEKNITSWENSPRESSQPNFKGSFLSKWTALNPWRLAPTNFTRKLALQRLAVVVLLIRSTTGITTPSSVCTRKREESFTDGISSSRWSEQVQPRQAAAHGGGGARRAAREGRRP